MAEQIMWAVKEAGVIRMFTLRRTRSESIRAAEHGGVYPPWKSQYASGSRCIRVKVVEVE